ncbi:GntR family transcriptional regulator [Providencia burhodogranariea]|uniref:GntR family transcriptional regulator n=1 Tax=Providencia burhodogranariea DSM 19968 TaxID=1141662 RepID=K8X395_9GAMM|nr:GntR family transcriptional regulator [Providencia burhodogranariea DSM 19968]
MTNIQRSKVRREALSEKVYQALKNDIFEFRMLPGDHFSESEIAERMEVSRTPVRQALFWLEREGYVEAWFRSGWQVKPLNFEYFEELYDLRTVLECEAVRRLGYQPIQHCQNLLAELRLFWIDNLPIQDGKLVSLQDEAFHIALVKTLNNEEMLRIHNELTEKIRIVRRLDFTRDDRINATYQEHSKILQAIFQQQTGLAQHILTEHIAASKAEVRKITLHMLHQAKLQVTQ